MAVLIAASSAIAHTAGAQLKELDNILQGKSLGGQIIKGAAVGYAVHQSGKQLNSFINTVTLRNHVPQNLATKVVPILSVGERGYIGGAQVAGPKSLVDKVQAVWQYEEGFNRGEYRIKALVPSSSLNPLAIKRVPKVGMSALIDVSLGGGFSSSTRSGSVGVSRVIRAAAVAGVVVAAAKPLNHKDPMTHVVPQASFGETAYIGGAQVTGSSGTSSKVKAVFEYWDSFDKGRYRIRVLVPVNGIDPTKIRRVEGAGVLALIDTSIAVQKNASHHRQETASAHPNIFGSRLQTIVIGKPRRHHDDDEDEDDKHADRPNRPHDNGWHKGWYKNGKDRD